MIFLNLFYDSKRTRLHNLHKPDNIIGMIQQAKQPALIDHFQYPAIQMQYIKISKYNKKRPYQAYHLCYSKQCSSQSIQPLDYRQSADQPAGVK